jgi:VanZ family protein
MPTNRIRLSKPSFIKAYWAALSWAAFILLLMSLPGKDLPDIDFWAIDIEDKLAHVAVFGLLAILMVWGLAKRRDHLTKKSLWVVFLIGAFYGGATEILQGVAFPTRFASVLDFVADTIGSALGTVFAISFYNKLRRQKS